MPRRTPGKHAAPRPRRDGTQRRDEVTTPAPRSTATRGGRHAVPSSPHRFVTAAPRVLGVAALAVATTGAMQTSSSTLAASGTTASAGSVSGSVAVVTGAAPSTVQPAVRLERSQRISRDSARDALGKASGGDLSAPKGGQGRQRNGGIKKLAANAEKAAQKIAENGWQLPLDPGTYRLTARFGQCSGLWSHCHTGLDFAAPSGTPVKAVANGVITETGWAGAYGNRIILTLEDGTEIWFCHLTSFTSEPGQPVGGGQTIGTVGSTGNSTGPHLHVEVRPGGGDAVDPDAAFNAHGTRP